MKETISTIPVNEAFNQDCECSLCFLEKKLEDEYVDYMLGPSLMEPDARIDTNQKGFCRRHFQLLYNKQSNKLGLGLIVDTHMIEKNLQIQNLFEDKIASLEKDSNSTFFKNISNKVSSKQTETSKTVNDFLNTLENLEKSCVICDKLDYTLDRYYEVVFQLWLKEHEFKKTFTNTKGFCMRHFKKLIEHSEKNLNTKETAVFLQILITLQLENMKRVQEDVNWFTKKFDYRYNDSPWKNSKDALPRSIQKIVGFCELK